jgi:signal peptidase I
MEYEIDSKIPLPELRDPGQIFASQSRDTFKYIAPLTVEEVNHYVKNKSDIFSIKKHLREELSFDSLYAKASSPGIWSTDEYGPLKIPSQGDSIFVNDTNYKLYHNIPEIHPGLNIIKENLYFLMGDNRHFVEDSRFIGLISQSKMYGIVIE